MGSGSSAVFVVITHVAYPNGTAHRMARGLRRRGNTVHFCGLPMPGAPRFTFESRIEGSEATEVRQVADRPVRWREVWHNQRRIYRFLREVTRQGTPDMVISCDPLAQFQAWAAGIFRRRRRPAILLYMVDYSAQRLEAPLVGPLYRALLRIGFLTADLWATVHPRNEMEFRRNFAGFIGRKQHFLLPNIPLGSSPARGEDAPLDLVYSGTLSEENGALLLSEVARLLHERGTGLTIAVQGDGPALKTVLEAAGSLPNLSYVGVSHDPDDVASFMSRGKVGLALYDPEFPMFRGIGSDSLKIRDYLSCGLTVISTLTGEGSLGERIHVCGFEGEAIAKLAVALSADSGTGSDAGRFTANEEAEEALGELEEAVRLRPLRT